MQSRGSGNIRGIDISSWQNGIDYRKVKQYKNIVIIKATEGVDYIDKMLESHYKGAKAAGLKIGFYHFFSDKTNPTQQARDFWNAIKGKQFEVLPVLDVESSTRSKTDVTNRCLEFLQEMKKLTGYDCIVYTYTSFVKEKLDSRLGKYLLWIAHYGVNTPGSNGIWNSWVGFQYTDKENVPGVPDPCDADEFTEGIFINGASGEYGIVTASALNVREEASANSKKIGLLQNGEKVHIFKEYGDWYSIYYGEHGGYVSAQYIRHI